MNRPDDDIGLDDFRARTLTMCEVGCVALAFGLMFLFSHPRDTEAWVPVAAAGLYAVAALTFVVGRLNLTLGAWVLVEGLMVLACGTAWVPSLKLVIYLMPALVVFSSIFVGFSGGWIAAVAASANLGAALALGAPISRDGVAIVLGLSWTNALVTWLASQPTRTALRWSWNSYRRAEDETRRAMRQQSEFAQLAKSLNVAQDRLEELNYELDRARRAAEDASRLKAEFAASVSHELRTPLNLIIGFSEVMALGTGNHNEQPLPPAYLRDVDTIYRNARHLSSLIDDILDLSQIDAARMGLMRERVDLMRLVAEAVSSIEPLYLKQGISIATEVPAGLPPVFADRTRVRQVLINLLGNAVRFTSVGGVRIGVELQEREILVAVADTGVGIAPNDLPRVFQEFMQVGATTSQPAGSSGLGLSISKRLIELHGGSMWVNSQPGQGSTFCFTLPLCDNVVSVGLHPAWETWLRPNDPSPRLVVVCGKEAELLRLFQRYLDGYQVTVVRNLSDVRSLLKSKSVYALVLTGSIESDLWQQAQQLRRETRNLPVLVCPLRGRLHLASELGITEYLVKPIRSEEIAQALRRNGRLARDVVVIDDDPDMVRLLGRMIRLVARRTKVRGAYGGAEGLAMLRERKPDLVLLDLLMPDVDGYAVLQAMRSDEVLRSVPVAVVTARGAQEEVTTGDVVSITQGSGMSVAEVMRLAKVSLDSLSENGASSDSARQAVPPG